MNNKEIFDRYVELFKQIERIDDSTKAELIKYLGANNFFSSPLTAENFYSYEGGLALFCTKLYELLDFLNTNLNLKYSKDTLLIISLFSLLGKLNYYTTQIKRYQEDNVWKSKDIYVVNKSQEREVYGDLGLNTYMFLSRYVPLTDEEIVAIIHFNCGYVNEESRDFIEVCKRYPLLTLLQSASRMILYVPFNLEREEEQAEEQAEGQLSIFDVDEEVPFV